MSYVSFGATDCPPGWTTNSSGDCVSPAGSTCPPGFVQHANECWPGTETACKEVMGTFFNPLTPDRCKKSCPAGTTPDANNVCRQDTSLMSMVKSSPGTVAVAATGVVLTVVLLKWMVS